MKMHIKYWVIWLCIE